MGRNEKCCRLMLMSISISAYWSSSTVGSRLSWSRPQAVLYMAAVALAVVFACAWPSAVPMAAGALALGGYALVVLMRVAAVLAGLVFHDVESATASGESGEPWPVYTVLLPVYREASVLPALRQALDALDYPRDRLDALILVEEDDAETRAAAEAVATDWLRVLVVPPGEPRTKPRACNAGLAAARGRPLDLRSGVERSLCPAGSSVGGVRVASRGGRVRSAGRRPRAAIRRARGRRSGIGTTRARRWSIPGRNLGHVVPFGSGRSGGCGRRRGRAPGLARVGAGCGGEGAHPVFPGVELMAVTRHCPFRVQTKAGRKRRGDRGGLA